MLDAYRCDVEGVGAGATVKGGERIHHRFEWRDRIGYREAFFRTLGA
jgi:hypothetical protein